MENKFYVYLHRRLDTGEIFYVGKGSRRRAWDSCQRNPWWKNINQKSGFDVDVCADSLSQVDAFKLEKELISLLKKLGVGLTNLSDGGEGGATGYKYSGDKLQRLQEHIKVQVLKISDPNIYTFYHFSGKTFEGTRMQFCETYSILSKDIAKLFQTKGTRKVVKNWALSPIEIKLIPKEPLTSPQRRSTNSDKGYYTFYHVLGDKFVGTRSEFSDYSQISLMKIAGLFCKNPRRSVYGWSLEEIKPSEYTHLKS